MEQRVLQPKLQLALEFWELAQGTGQGIEARVIGGKPPLSCVAIDPQRQQEIATQK